MTERGILMKGPMVRATLQGTKTMTRRVVKPQPPAHVTGIHELRRTTTTGSLPLGCWEWLREDQPAGVDGVRCPYGQPGDRLWVRETWRRMDGFYHYAADGLMVPAVKDREARAVLARRAPLPSTAYGWKPSIHMPREASRLTLEITEVRVERLNEISEADARAEGVDWETCPTVQTQESFEAQIAARRIGMAAHYVAEVQYRGGFERLWESINGPGSWAANPWVWVIVFRRSTH